MTSVKRVKARKISKGESVIEEVSDKVNKSTEGVVLNKVPNKKVRARKIRMSLSKAEEQKLDKAIEREDNMSVIVMILILALCFVVGISLGYVLYKIALTGRI